MPLDFQSNDVGWFVEDNIHNVSDASIQRMIQQGDYSYESDAPFRAGGKRPQSGKVADALMALVVGYSCSVNRFSGGDRMGAIAQWSRGVEPLYVYRVKRPLSAHEAMELARQVSAELRMSMAAEWADDLVELFSDFDDSIVVS